MSHLARALAFTMIGPSLAIAASQGGDEFKATLGLYQVPGDTGHDMNLRWQRNDTHAWVGAYRDRSFGSQARAGVDGSWQLASGLALQPSLQLATQGFVGGSVNAVMGGDWYGLAGWGRTNLRPYVNLNFDPNDAYTLGLGWRGDSGPAWSLMQIVDDRLGTGQRHSHLNARWTLGDQRLTVDLLHKSGRGDDGVYIRAWGASVGWDWSTVFVKLAVDPHQNFTTQNALRWSAGLRW